MTHYEKFAQCSGTIQFIFVAPTTLKITATAENYVAEHVAVIGNQIDIVQAIDTVIRDWSEFHG
jgi:hypothetical protein